MLIGLMNRNSMTRKCLLLLIATFVLHACGGGSETPQTAPDGTIVTPEGASFFSNIDDVIATSATGDRLITERFYVLMSRLSVYALICDPNNNQGYSAQFSKVWNRSTKLQALAEKVYGGEKPAYNRFEKQRNIESHRLSFESPPNTCANSKSTFSRYVNQSASSIASTIESTARGSF